MRRCQSWSLLPSPSSLSLPSLMIKKVPGSSCKQPGACSLGRREHCIAGDSISRKKRETSRWDSALRLRLTAAVLTGQRLLVCSGWIIRTLNTPDSLQVSGPCLFSSHHHPRTNRRSQACSALVTCGSTEMHPEAPSQPPRDQVDRVPHHRALLSTHTGAG